MNPAAAGPTAADLLNTLPERELATLIRENSDEKWAARIARFVVERRQRRPYATVGQLVETVLAAMPAAARPDDKHAATRTFQALRIAVNDELTILGHALESAVDRLGKGGTIAVLSYHSFEDRIVKQLFARLAGRGEGQGPFGTRPPAALELLTRQPRRPVRGGSRRQPARPQRPPAGCPPSVMSLHARGDEEPTRPCHAGNENAVRCTVRPGAAARPRPAGGRPPLRASPGGGAGGPPAAARAARPRRTGRSRMARSEARLLAFAVAGTALMCAVLVIYLAAYAHVSQLGLEQARARRSCARPACRMTSFRRSWRGLQSPARVIAAAPGAGHGACGTRPATYIPAQDTAAQTADDGGGQGHPGDKRWHIGRRRHSTSFRSLSRAPGWGWA